MGHSNCYNSQEERSSPTRQVPTDKNNKLELLENRVWFQRVGCSISDCKHAICLDLKWVEYWDNKGHGS